MWFSKENVAYTHEGAEKPVDLSRRLCRREDLHELTECGFPIHMHEGYFPPDPTRDQNKAFSENPTPKKGTIMTNLSAKQSKAIQIAAVSVLTIIAVKQTNKVAKLERALRISEAQKDFYTDVAVRSTSMMNLPQMLHLVDDAVNDMHFRQIVRRSGLQ